MNNYDRIKNMSIEEMAGYFQKLFDPHKDRFGCLSCLDYGTHHYLEDCGDCCWLTIGGNILKYLEQEANNEK